MENFEYERICACALNRIFGYEPKISGRIISELGSASAVFSLGKEELFELFGPSSKYRECIGNAAIDAAQEELKRLSGCGCQFLSRTEPGFPSLLLECEDCPAGLYIKSETPAEELFNEATFISIVGTRDISPYGREWCPKIVSALSSAQSCPVIVSGLAIGVDICAQRAALDLGIPTIGILPVGIDDVYPKSHFRDAARISSTPGCALVTDYPPGTPPAAINFLRRNRIIAGISRSTILVESKKSGGGTMTARLAAGYGRDVFALGGRIDDSISEGCNVLIGEKIAEPIYSIDNLTEAVGLGKYNRQRTRDLLEEVGDYYSKRGSTEDTEALKKICLLIRKNRGISIDELCVAANLPYSETSFLVGVLENDGFVFMDLLQRCTIVTKIG